MTCQVLTSFHFLWESLGFQGLNHSTFDLALRLGELRDAGFHMQVGGSRQDVEGVTCQRPMVKPKLQRCHGETVAGRLWLLLFAVHPSVWKVSKWWIAGVVGGLKKSTLCLIYCQHICETERQNLAFQMDWKPNTLVIYIYVYIYTWRNSIFVDIYIYIVEIVFFFFYDPLGSHIFRCNFFLGVYRIYVVPMQQIPCVLPGSVISWRISGWITATVPTWVAWRRNSPLRK